MSILHIKFNVGAELFRFSTFQPTQNKYISSHKFMRRNIFRFLGNCAVNWKSYNLPVNNFKKINAPMFLLILMIHLPFMLQAVTQVASRNFTFLFWDQNLWRHHDLILGFFLLHVALVFRVFSWCDVKLFLLLNKFCHIKLTRHKVKAIFVLPHHKLLILVKFHILQY